MNSAERLKVVKKHVIGGAHEPHIHNRAIKGVSQQGNFYLNNNAVKF